MSLHIQHMKPRCSRCRKVGRRDARYDHLGYDIEIKTGNLCECRHCHHTWVSKNKFVMAVSRDLERVK